MTYKEALEYAKEQKEMFDGKYEDFLALATFAIEKQIPKKPWGKYNMCQTCGIVVLGRPGHCPNCGQKLNWGNEE